jgi:hypothetical protein
MACSQPKHEQHRKQKQRGNGVVPGRDSLLPDPPDQNLGVLLQPLFWLLPNRINVAIKNSFPTPLSIAVCMML